MKCYTCWKLWWCQNCFFCPGARPPDTTFNELIRPNPRGPSACTKVSVDLQSRHSQNWKSRKARSSSEKMDSLQPSLCTALQPRCNRVATAFQPLSASSNFQVFQGVLPMEKPTFSTESKRSSTPACFSSNTWEYREWAMDANCKREYVEHVSGWHPLNLTYNHLTLFTMMFWAQ